MNKSIASTHRQKNNGYSAFTEYPLSRLPTPSDRCHNRNSFNYFLMSTRVKMRGSFSLLDWLQLILFQLQSTFFVCLIDCISKYSDYSHLFSLTWLTTIHVSMITVISQCIFYWPPFKDSLSRSILYTHLIDLKHNILKYSHLSTLCKRQSDTRHPTYCTKKTSIILISDKNWHGDKTFTSYFPDAVRKSDFLVNLFVCLITLHSPVFFPPAVSGSFP